MRTHIGLLVVWLILAGTAPALAANDKPEVPTKVTSRGLTPEEKAEKEARKACKIEICGILATKEEHGPDVACDIGWTWRQDEIADALGGRIDWPWGKMVCQSKLRLGRMPLAKTMSAPRFKIVTETQTVRCSLHRADGKPYVVEIALAPKATFENGKAIEAAINWGDVSAPAAIYPMLYAATSLDNSTNVLGAEVARLINEFTDEECAEVRSELPDGPAN